MIKAFVKIMVASFCTLVTVTGVVFSQQIGDPTFDPEIENPAYMEAQGPVITIDEAHNNFHTMEGRFNAFANVVRADGYQVKQGKAQFSKETLEETDILVVSNAIHKDNLGKWSLPTPSAFTPKEIAALNAWVREGGSLFLIADHMPFPGAAEALAKSFDVTFYNGFAINKNKTSDLFTIDNGGLIVSNLTKGRVGDPPVTSVRTFTGQCFKVPEEATPVLVLDDKYENRMPETAWKFEENTTITSAEGYVQGAYMKYGKGRFVVFGEAAMFTSQKSGNRRFGLSAPDASQNVQLLLNILHWLDHTIN